jgi:outer membrane protein OmpA-like peptidoglycan-associated protein
MTPYPRYALPVLVLLVLAACSTGAPRHGGSVHQGMDCRVEGDVYPCDPWCAGRTSGDYLSADGCRFNLHDGTNDIPYFATRSDGIDAEAQKALVLAAKIMKKYGHGFEIVGNAAHCDDEAANQALSARRAENVKQALLALGVPADQIVSVSARGSTQSLQSTPPSCSDHSNDRVDLNLVEVGRRASSPE